jgi:hypothetical protein
LDGSLLKIVLSETYQPGGISHETERVWTKPQDA